MSPIPPTWPLFTQKTHARTHATPVGRKPLFLQAIVDCVTVVGVVEPSKIVLWEEGGKKGWGSRVWVRFGKDMAESLWVTTRTLQSRMLPSRRWGGDRWESGLKYLGFTSSTRVQCKFFFMHERCDKFCSLETLLFILLSHLVIIYICKNFYIVARVHTSWSQNTSLQRGIIFKSNRFKQVRYKAIFLECWVKDSFHLAIAFAIAAVLYHKIFRLVNSRIIFRGIHFNSLLLASILQ